MNKDNSEYEIDRELTWKFAIEKNAEYQDRIAELEEENKKLKEKVETLELWLDNKEKLNEEYRKEIAEQETEWHWLFDEIEYRKRECKKLKKDVDYRHHRAMVAERWWEDED